METNELHRGRLIDHLQLVVPDLARSKRFYGAIFEVLGVPIGGEGPGFFWADELFVSDLASPAGAATGRTHLAFQAADRKTVEQFHGAGLAVGGTTGRRGTALPLSEPRSQANSGDSAPARAPTRVAGSAPSLRLAISTGAR